MEPLRTYDYLTLTRQRVFTWIRPISAEHYTGDFPPWRKSLGGTLTHIMVSEWYYVQRIQGREVPPYEDWPIRDEQPPPFSTLEATWAEQADHTRAALSAVRAWDAKREYAVTDDDGRPCIVTTSAADLFTQLAFHEVHHRAQIMGMLRQFGVAIEDLDFNAFMFDRREVL
jgi:uncharacterized damage-inducible protein DinB